MRTKISKVYSYVVMAINQLSRIAGIIAILFLLSMMFLTVFDVLLRYIFNAPISGSVELNEYFMVVAGLFGLAWCALKGGHIKIDFIMKHFPHRCQAIINSFTFLLAIGVVILVAWQGFSEAYLVKQDNISSDVLHIPAFPFYFAVGIGYALLSVALIPFLTDSIRKAITK